MNKRHGNSGEALGPAVLAALAASAFLAWVWSLQGPADLQAMRNMGQAHFEEKRTAAAIEIFAQVVAAPDATAADWRNLALARYELSGDEATDDSILTALENADALAPGHAATHFFRGLVYSRRGRDAEASAEFASGAASDGTDPATLYNWAAALHNQGLVDNALPLYERVIDMGFDIGQQFFVSSLYRTGRALIVGQGIDAARPFMERYQEHQPRLSQAQRAATALEAGRHKRIEVPRTNLVAANPATAADLSFDARAVGVASPAGQGSVAARDVGAGVAIVLADDRGDVNELVTAIPVAGPLLALGDVDRDGLPDAVVASGDGLKLFRNMGSGEFVPAETTGFPAMEGVRAADWVDADHDGDLDLMILTGEDGRGFRWIANHGDWSFAELTEEAGLGGGAARAMAWADFDDDSDVDFYVIRDDGDTSLYSNARANRFVELGASVGAGGRLAATGAAAEDFDNDGWFDLLRSGPMGAELLINNGDGTFGAPLTVPSDAAGFHVGDLNNDGWLDLVDDAGRIFVNDGGPGFVAANELDDVHRVLDLVDHDGDGSLDVLVDRSGELILLTQPAPLGGWMRLGLHGVKNNLEGIGGLIEVKVGGAYQRRLQRARWLHLGLGTAAAADVVRVTWPNGIIQNETDVLANATLEPIGEVERLEGSCPLLYTWDGTEWRFINEVLGVAPLGMPLSADVIHPADYDEYVPIPGEALQPRDGFLEVRLTEELREAGYLDAVRLLAVDHPVGTEIYPDERFVPPPHPEFGIYSVEGAQPVKAVDQDGRDWTGELARLDGTRARPFEPYLYEGLATEHHLEFVVPASSTPAAARLILTGWVYWATGSINLQVDEDPRVRFAPVRLDVPNGRGGWHTAIEDIGLPNAKNSTLVVELDGVIRPADPRIRLVTTMRLYWDAAAYAEGDASGLYRPNGDWHAEWGVPEPGGLEMRGASGQSSGIAPRVHVLAPETATIRWRGFSELTRDVDGFESFSYANVSSSSNWNQHRGSYTRYGELDDLLDQADDRLVLIGTGDEVAVRFRDELPEVATGWRRDWLLYLNGWVKDGDPNTVGGDRVEPLPTHRMREYPREALTVDDAADGPTWRSLYNTRPAREVNVPLRPQR
ncbi:MAG: hypothetical protein GKS06_18545 [Acidobacteria bacterium]|nr:hypothetical protein [Acidobacteriota bacterium]